MNNNNRTTKNYASGIGGAHIGFHMFGARGPLLEENDSSGGSANPNGGQPSGAPAPGAAGEPTGTPPSAGVKAVFTPEQQAEVNRIAARAREEGRQAATSQTTAPKEKPTATPAATGNTEILALRQEMDFKEAASDLGVPRDIRKDMLDLARAQGATDFGQWLESKRALWSKPQGQNQTQPPAGAPAEPAKPPPTAAPASAAGNTVNPITSGGLVDFWHMTTSQLDQMTPSGVRREYEKHIAEGSRMAGAPRVPTAPKR